MTKLCCPQCGSTAFYAIEQATLKHYAEIDRSADGIEITIEENHILVKDAMTTTLGYQCANEDECAFFVPAHEIASLSDMKETA